MERTLKSRCVKNLKILPQLTPETVITFDRWDGIISEVQACRIYIYWHYSTTSTASRRDDKPGWNGLFSKGLLARGQIFNYRKALLRTNGAIRPESSEHNHYIPSRYMCISIARG